MSSFSARGRARHPLGELQGLGPALLDEQRDPAAVGQEREDRKEDQQEHGDRQQDQDLAAQPDAAGPAAPPWVARARPAHGPAASGGMPKAVRR